MGDIKLPTKSLKCSTAIASTIICFDLIWNAQHKKTAQAMTNYIFSCLSNAVASRKPEKVSTVTCKYNFPKSEM